VLSGIDVLPFSAALEHAVPLPMLDSGGDVVEAQAVGRCEGCARHRDGGVTCWTWEGKPTRAHRGDGRARALAWIQDGFHGSWCVATDTSIVCDDPSRPGDALEIPMRADALAGGDVLCALGDDRLACLDRQLYDTWPVQVDVGGPAKDVTNNSTGGCAATVAGALVCWGAPFGPLGSPADAASEAKIPHDTPFPQPTTLRTSAVVGVKLAYHAWCVTTSTGSTCVGDDFPNGLSARAPVVDLSMFGICTLESGRVRCNLPEKKIPKRVATALAAPGVTGMDGSVFDWGCVVRGQRATCWDEEHSQEIEAPGPIAQSLRLDHETVLRLEDGRVLRVDNKDGTSELLGLAAVEDLRRDPRAYAWCARTGERWVCDQQGKRTEQQQPPVTSSRCWLEDANVYCMGSRAKGVTGQPWSPTRMTTLRTLTPRE